MAQHLIYRSDQCIPCVSVTRLSWVRCSSNCCSCRCRSRTWPSSASTFTCKRTTFVISRAVGSGWEHEQSTIYAARLPHKTTGLPHNQQFAVRVGVAMLCRQKAGAATDRCCGLEDRRVGDGTTTEGAGGGRGHAVFALLDILSFWTHTCLIVALCSGATQRGCRRTLFRSSAYMFLFLPPALQWQ